MAGIVSIHHGISELASFKLLFNYALYMEFQCSMALTKNKTLGPLYPNSIEFHLFRTTVVIRKTKVIDSTILQLSCCIRKALLEKAENLYNQVIANIYSKF